MMVHCIVINFFISYKLKKYIRMYVAPTIDIETLLKEAPKETNVETIEISISLGRFQIYKLYYIKYGN